MDQQSLKQLALKLFDIDAVKFGNFTTKIGLPTPIYFDLRVMVSYPHVLDKIATFISELVLNNDSKCDHICGIPYTALPIATLVSVKSKLPMLMRRKEVKSYGTKKIIEGHYKSGDTCVIIEDVITSGSSILETVADLKKEGIKVSKAYIVVDREHGGKENLNKNGIEVVSLFTMSKLTHLFFDIGKIDRAMLETVSQYMKDVHGNTIKVSNNEVNRTMLTWDERGNLSKNIIAKKLFNIMSTKKTNLCVALDLTKTTDILNMVEKIGQYICVLKTHIDIIEDFNENFTIQLKNLADSHNFLIMEDRKFADIGNTVSLQFSKGIFKISEWADLVTAHSLPGNGVLKGIDSVMKGKDVGVFLLAEMSSEGNLVTSDYSKETIKLAMDNQAVVSGVVCQTNIFNEPGLIQLTPGVKLDDSRDELGQAYNSPSDVILKQGCDVAVVGRGIIRANKPKEMAKKYRDLLWEAYLKRVEKN